MDVATTSFMYRMKATLKKRYPDEGEFAKQWQAFSTKYQFLTERPKSYEESDDIHYDPSKDESGGDIFDEAEVDDHIAAWKEYYSEQPLDCPDSEWPLFNGKGDDLPRFEYGRTEIHVAVMEENVELIENLLDSDFDLSLVDNGGLTAIELAYIENKSQSVALFRKWGLIPS